MLENNQNTLETIVNNSNLYRRAISLVVDKTKYYADRAWYLAKTINKWDLMLNSGKIAGGYAIVYYVNKDFGENEGFYSMLRQLPIHLAWGTFLMRLYRRFAEVHTERLKIYFAIERQLYLTKGNITNNPNLDILNSTNPNHQNDIHPN